MPMNLIEQQNQLRGLPDDALPNQMQSGSVPPFLVLSEISRRKTARERYEAQASKYKAAQPTVAQELLGATAPRGLDAAAMMGGQQTPAPMAPQGIDAALPPQLDATPQGYANGGMVGYAGGGLADILKVYQDRYTALGDPKKQALKQALMSIGAGMVGGGSSNFMKNVGAGLSAGVPAYQNALSAADDEAMKLLQLQAGLTSTIESQKLAEANAARDAKLDALRLTQAEREAAMAGLPSDAAAIIADKNLEENNPELYSTVMAGRTAAAGVQNASDLDKKISDVVADVANSNPLPKFTDNTGNSIFNSPEEYDAAVKVRNKVVIDETFRRLQTEAGDAAAMEYLSRVRSGAMSPVMAQSAGASTGASPAGTMWTDYFN